MLTLQKMGEQLKRYRKSYKLDQADIANIAGVAQNTYSGWENGQKKPNFFSILAISQYYGVSIEDLFNLPLAGTEGAKKNRSKPKASA